MTRRAPIADLARLCAGLTVWASAFVSLYVLLSIGCAYGWEDRTLGPVSLQRAVLVANWLAHLALVVAILVWSQRRARHRAGDPDAFLARAAVWANLVALVAVIVNYAPVLPLSTCL